MGCIHCMNRATSSGQHMSFDTFKKVIDFQKKYGSSFCVISGGEPTEHPEFVQFLGYAVQELPYCFITVTTNGQWLTQNEGFIRFINGRNGDKVIFQVTYDKRYYPIPLDIAHPVFQLPNVVLCDKVEHIFPQGRALDNNLEWQSKASKCFNVRAIANQMTVKDFGTLVGMLAIKVKFCTPHIDIHGNIKVGESDLCPICSHIDKTSEQIVQDIANFRCNQCNHVNCNLPEEYKKVIGE